MIDKYNTRLLSICSSFRRPEMLFDMLETFYIKRTDDKTQIFVYLHDDDPQLDNYKKLIAGHKEKFGFDLNYKIGRHRCLREVVNHVVFSMYREIPYYQIICDDHLYLTQNWDSILIKRYVEVSNGWGWCCGDDMLNDDWYTWQHPGAEIWSWKFVNAIGYVYPRTLNHRGLDLYTKDLGLSLENGIVFVPEVKIKHLLGCDSVTDDANSKETYSQSNYETAVVGIQQWVEIDKDDCIERIKNGVLSENCLPL